MIDSHRPRRLARHEPVDAINTEQLATATDRLLGRERLLQRLARGSTPRIVPSRKRRTPTVTPLQVVVLAFGVCCWLVGALIV